MNASNTPIDPDRTNQGTMTQLSATTQNTNPIAATTSVITTGTADTPVAPTVPHQSAVLLVVGWHRSNFLEFFHEHSIHFHPDWSWKTFIITIAHFIVENSEDEVLNTNWAKIPGGESLMFIKLSSAAACSRGFDILCKSKGFAGCRVELRCS